MGANLLPTVRRFIVQTINFQASHCAVQEGCVSVGSRKLLRFDFLSWNAGDTDLRMGDPSQNPQWYQFSPCHGHYHLRDFNTFKIFDCRGRERRRGAKQAFCLIDLERRSGRPGPQFTDCNQNQGVSAGWADLYDRSLDCQWLDITGLADGEYMVEARTNAYGLAPEDNYGDNYTWAGIRIAGNNVTEIPPPCYPEDCIGFNPLNVQAQEVAGRWKVVDGGHWILDFGSNGADAQKARDIIRRYGMNRICYVGRPSATADQLMMYFKINSRVPSGPFPGEDAIPFNASNVAAQEIGGRWKVTEGAMSMLDFGVSEANARKAAWIIQRHQFRYQCFVGRPNAEMMYFRK